MRFLILISLLFCSGISFSQEHSEHMMPGRTIEPELAASYPDSAEFAKLFKEFYPSIKPEKSLKEQADQYFQAIARSFKMMGIDSAEAAKAAFKNLDQSAFEKIYFETYRKNLTAKQLKKYMEFIKTPEGKHIAEIWTNLERAPGEANMYLVRAMNTNLTPIRQAAHEKMMKEHPPENHSMTPGMQMQPGHGTMTDPRHSAVKDSLATPQPKQ